MGKKRRTKRVRQKILKAFFTPFALIALFYVVLNDLLNPILVPLIRKVLKLHEDSVLSEVLFYFALSVFIAIIAYLLSRLYLNISKPNKKYFQRINFLNPDPATLARAAEGILNSEKTEPYFVHVAPVCDEIEQIFEKLRENGFVWENGQPGDGKSMLAYHAIHKLRKRFRMPFFPGITLLRLKYRPYRLNLNKVSQESDIREILDELDWLKGKKRKIILIDDAHRIKFEDKLRYEFEEEAREKLNGKFIWINTNYLEIKESEFDNSIRIDFEKFYPRLLEDFYQTKNPVVAKVIAEKVSALDEAIRMKETGKISDPWHFNFVAADGFRRIWQLLNKLSSVNDELDILKFSIFLFSARNIIGGEKEFTQNDFVSLLQKVDSEYFKRAIDKYTPEKIITGLSAQDKGRFIIIGNKNSLDRGYLYAPHFKMSIAILHTFTSSDPEQSVASGQMVREMLSITCRLLLTREYENHKYFGAFFNALGSCQRHFLDEFGDWVRQYMNHLVADHMVAHGPLLKTLRKNHPAFYRDLVTDDYLQRLAEKVSAVEESNFIAAANLIRALDDHKIGFIKLLDFERLGNTINKAQIGRISHASMLITALGDEKKQLTRYLDWPALARQIAHADFTLLAKAGPFMKSVGDDIRQLTSRFDEHDWERLAQAALKAGTGQLSHLEVFIYALGEDSAVFLGMLERLGQEKLIQKINNAEVGQLEQVATFLRALGTLKKMIITNLDWPRLAAVAVTAEAGQLFQLSSFINALEESKPDFIREMEHLGWGRLIEALGAAKVSHFFEAAEFINSLQEHKMSFLSGMSQEAWDRIGQQAVSAGAVHLHKISNLILALGPYKAKLTDPIKADHAIAWSLHVDQNQIRPLCIVIDNMAETEQSRAIKDINWLALMEMINLRHHKLIRDLSYVLNYQNLKMPNIGESPERAILDRYLSTNRNLIIYFSTFFFSAPDDFQVTSLLVRSLSVLDPDAAREIVRRLGGKFRTQFDIPPRFYESFTNFLSAISSFDVYAALDLIRIRNVREHLTGSLQDELQNRNDMALQQLLEVIAGIDPSLSQEMMRKKAALDRSG